MKVHFPTRWRNDSKHCESRSWRSVPWQVAASQTIAMSQTKLTWGAHPLLPHSFPGDKRLILAQKWHAKPTKSSSPHSTPSHRLAISLQLSSHTAWWSLLNIDLARKVYWCFTPISSLRLHCGWLNCGPEEPHVPEDFVKQMLGDFAATQIDALLSKRGWHHLDAFKLKRTAGKHVADLYWSRKRGTLHRRNLKGVVWIWLECNLYYLGHQ